MSARHALEHRLWGILREHGLAKKRFVIACSGGADSVALMRAFVAVLPADRLVVAHVHHGNESSGHRDRAQDFTISLAASLGLRAESRRHEGRTLSSEADLRRARRGFLEDIRLTTGFDFIAAAHHADDLTETRLIRLVRGTGPEGLRAMRPVTGAWFRPFLEISAADLRTYLVSIAQDHLEDPSNSDPRFLRNWMRHHWLPALEKRRPGAVAALGRSLGDMAQALTKVGAGDEESAAPVIDRARWESAAVADRLSLLAECLRRAGQMKFTRGQLEEIRKRLDNRQKEHTFELAGCEWAVNVQQIRARLRG